MSHYQQFLAMLNAAGVVYRHGKLDSIIIRNRIEFIFDAAGNLKDVCREYESPY